VQEIVAGTNEQSVVIFDIETEQPKCSARIHQDDVNAVAFVDDACNVIVSGSDDTTLVITDRCAAARQVCSASNCLLTTSCVDTQCQSGRVALLCCNNSFFVQGPAEDG
jgi:WD40 repeat protein